MRPRQRQTVRFDRHYNIAQFENALTLLMKDYDRFKTSEGYQFDVNTLLRQCVANSAYPVYQEFTSAYQNRNVSEFDQASAEFLDLLDLQEQVLKLEQKLDAWKLARAVQKSRRKRR